MNQALARAKETFILGMSRISHFWGFPKAMGAIYGAIYLSPQPVSLDDLVVQVNVTKGAVSTNVRALERLGMVYKVDKIGQRKDFYTAETDLWKILKGILREREKNDFDRGLSSIDDSLVLLKDAEMESSQAELPSFYLERLWAMRAFFQNLDRLMASILELEQLSQQTFLKISENNEDDRNGRT
jgi:DNA-binding transcriptional regulator GbsR (MarR family)